MRWILLGLAVPSFLAACATDSGGNEAPPLGTGGQSGGANTSSSTSGMSNNSVGGGLASNGGTTGVAGGTTQQNAGGGAPPVNNGGQNNGGTGATTTTNNGGASPAGGGAGTQMNTAGTANGGMMNGGGAPATGGTAGTPAAGGDSMMAEGGSGGTAPVATGTVSQQGSNVTLELGGLRMVIDGSTGARIVEFSRDGVNMLKEKPSDSTGYDYGSTFWPAPQDDWPGRWPPPDALDLNPYAVTVDDSSATLVSDAGFGLIVTKIFTFGADGDSISIEYQTVAESADVNFAPWEITRVEGGISFFSPGAASDVVLDNLPGLNTMGDIAWYTYDHDAAEAANANADPKHSQDGHGWVANADPDKNLLLIKSFPDIPASDMAPGHGEVELYGSPATTYVEVEDTGPYGAVTSSAPVSWTSTWHLVEIPAGTDVSEGSQGLVDLANTAMGL